MKAPKVPLAEREFGGEGLDAFGPVGVTESFPCPLFVTFGKQDAELFGRSPDAGFPLGRFITRHVLKHDVAHPVTACVARRASARRHALQGPSVWLDPKQHIQPSRGFSMRMVTARAMA